MDDNEKHQINCVLQSNEENYILGRFSSDNNGENSERP